jgi:anti-sigma factor RsiW
MHCLSFEPLLDRYVDGELSPAQGARVAAHAESCTECAAVLEELRVIDGLLLEPRQLEPAANFTFKVMAEARAIPAPHPHRYPHLQVLATYVVFAWVAIAGFLIFGGSAARAMVATIGVAAAHAGTELTRLSGLTGHIFGRQAYDVTAAMGGVIALDLMAAAALFFIYTRFRTQRIPAREGSQGW